MTSIITKAIPKIWVHPGIGEEIPSTPALRAAIARVKERGVLSVSKSPFYKGHLGESPRIEHSPSTVRYAPKIFTLGKEERRTC